MGITSFDHVNVRTAALDRMIAFYRTILGMEPGERPPFPFGGAWLYCAGRPVVHLVAVAQAPRTQEPRIEHFAFSAEGLADFLAHLRRHGIAYEIGLLPAWNVRQVNFHDPDGNHIHVDFPAHEQADLSAFSG